MEETNETFGEKMYRLAVDATEAEIGWGSRHAYLRSLEQPPGYFTQMGPKLLGDEIERLKKMVEERDSTLQWYRDIYPIADTLKRTQEENKTFTKIIETLREENTKLKAINFDLCNEVRELREATHDQRGGSATTIKDLKEKLEKAEAEIRELKIQNSNFESWNAGLRAEYARIDELNRKLNYSLVNASLAADNISSDRRRLDEFISEFCRRYDEGDF